MTDFETIVCPECKREQPDTAPFCQDCGYRMRSPKTMREPMMALTPDRVEAHEKAEQQKKSRPSSQSGKTTGRRPARKIMSAVDDAKEEAGADRSSERMAADRSSHTLVEGVRAVSVETGDDGDRAEDADESVEFQPVSTDSVPTQGRMTAPMASAQQRSRLRFIVATTLVACVIVIGGLSWLHLERQSAADEVDQPTTSVQILDIDGGFFRRGLAEDAEAFIIHYCYRYHSDPEEECDRERLLRGEYPEQTIEMTAFRIDSAPVRNKDYQRCVEDGGCEEIPFAECDVWTPRGLQLGVRVPEILRRDDHPVVCVDRQRAQTYCQWKDGKLPSHNQWEKTARGRDSYLFPWGDNWEPNLANWGESDVVKTSVAGKLDGYEWTSPPGAYPDGQSPFGADDMAGNVAEWVQGSDPLVGYVRGGSWLSNPFELRTTARVEREVGALRTDTGFRCAYP